MREVAAEVDCSIGTVQHYLHTKDDMLVFAFRQVVERTMTRALAVDQSLGVRPALAVILGQLLPRKALTDALASALDATLDG